MNHDDNPYYVAYVREKQARTEVEQLLEASTRQLYEKNLLLQQQINQIQQQQQSMIQQEKMALLGTLAAGIAHEINNPLAFILSNLETFGNYSQLLLQTVQDQQHQTTEHIMLVAEDLPELISETSEGLARIEAIVKNLLFFARADSDSPTEIQLAEALEFTLQLLQPMLHHTELHRNFLPVAPVRFQLNELNQVLLNIIVNAVQACEAVPARANRLQLHLSQTAQHVICKICDNGCGMSPDTLNRMFDAFFTTKEVGCGTGVGMAIVLRALQQHQCNIEVHSELGQGTEVAIFFPHAQQ
jgi:signal transduction histidine kinase